MFCSAIIDFPRNIFSYTFSPEQAFGLVHTKLSTSGFVWKLYHCPSMDSVEMLKSYYIASKNIYFSSLCGTINRSGDEGCSNQECDATLDTLSPFYGFQMSLTDPSGTLNNCRLAPSVAESITGVKVQFLYLPQMWHCFLLILFPMLGETRNFLREGVSQMSAEGY